MAICDACMRLRVKHEDHLAAKGLVECKASDDAGALLAAFDEFRAGGAARLPFKVVSAGGH